MWGIALGQHGFVGLTAFLAAMLLPGILAAKRAPPSTWGTAQRAVFGVLSVFTGLHMMDHLVNGMINPIFALCLGWLAGWAGRAEDELPGGDDESDLPTSKATPVLRRRYWLT